MDPNLSRTIIPQKFKTEKKLSIDDLKKICNPRWAFEHAAPLCYFKREVDLLVSKS